VAHALHFASAAGYLLAAIAAVAGLGLRVRAAQRAALAILALGALLHAAAFWSLHAQSPTPSLTELPLAASLMAWLTVLSYLALQLRVRGLALAALVAPAAFLGAFAGAVWLPIRVGASDRVHPLIAHLHVLLASAGFALLAVAGAAGALYLVHHRSIKAKRLGAAQSALPSLESLDRANGAALALGFTLLTLGVLTGVLWVLESEGRLWPGGVHANATLAVWLLYGVVAVLRFGMHEGARRAALQSAIGFGLLLVTVLGLRVWP
jgi:ABC-type transport system involved in cytochrome c biogenesis permease subunit